MGQASGTIARPREFLIVCVAGLLLAIVMTWPLAAGITYLGRTLPTDADGQFSIWNIAWVARTLVVDPLHLFNANIFHPHKLTLAYSEANLLPGAIGIPAYWLSRNPWLTLNVVLLFGFVSAYVAAYFLLAYLTGDRRAAAISAILYAFCPYVFAHLSHIQLLMTGGVPLSMLMLHRLVDGPSPRQGVWLGLALAAQALSCAYYGVFTGLMVGFATLLFATTRRLWASRTYWTAIAIAAATSLAIALPVFYPFLVVQEESGFTRTLQDTVRWAATPYDYLVSGARAHRWLLDFSRRFGPYQEVLFPGILAVLLGIPGLVLALRRAGRDREAGLVYTSLGVLALWASFGPSAGLYRVLFNLPTFSFLRAPSRLGLIVVLCLAVGAAFALRALLAAAAPRRASLITGVASAAAVADLIVAPIKWSAAPLVPPGYQVLKSQPRAAVAEFPFYGERIAFPLHTQYMLFSTAHWLPLVNGYSDVFPKDFRDAAPALASFPSDDAFLALAKRRVRYITVHWDMWPGQQDVIRQRLDRYLPNLRVLSSDERMTVFEVLRYP